MLCDYITMVLTRKGFVNTILIDFSFFSNRQAVTVTLKKILKILGKTKAAKVAGYGKSASWHWFQTGEKQKVPEMQALISWADHLKLNDAELGELVRDAHRTRVAVMELLAKGDRRRINTRSVLRRDLAKEILEEEKSRREETLDEMRVASEQKERYLSREREEMDRNIRLSQFSEKLEKLRRKNGDN